MDNKFKPGDRVRTVKYKNYTPLLGVGKEFTINGVAEYVSPSHGRLYTMKEASGGVYEAGLELIKDTLEEQLTKAKAALDRINALILERDSPKVGDRFCNATMTLVFTVLDVYRGRVFGRRENRLDPLRWPCQAASYTIDEFRRDWSKFS